MQPPAEAAAGPQEMQAAEPRLPQKRPDGIPAAPGSALSGQTLCWLTESRYPR